MVARPALRARGREFWPLDATSGWSWWAC